MSGTRVQSTDRTAESREPEAPSTGIEDRIEVEQPRPHGSKLTSIQACRGIAALLVVLYHTNMVFSEPRYWNSKPFGTVFDFGYAGVEFFFVLSGFIILHVHWSDLSRPRRVSRYLWKRFRRIYPIYWVVLFAIVPVFLLVHWGYEFQRNPMVILSSAMLVPLRNQDTCLPVAWTLYHEVLFYVVFAVSILNVRVGSLLLCVWLAGSILYPDLFVTSPYHLFFGMGAGCALILRYQKIRLRALVAALGICLFAGAGWLDLHTGDSFLLREKLLIEFLYGAGSSLAILGLVELERSAALKAGGLMLLLGDASYAIYLIHDPVLAMLGKIFAAAGLLQLPAQLSFIVFVGCATAAGVALHLWIERPLLRYLE